MEKLKLYLVSENKNYKHVYVEAKSFEDAEKKAILHWKKEREEQRKERSLKQGESLLRDHNQLSVETFNEAITEKPIVVHRMEIIGEGVVR